MDRGAVLAQLRQQMGNFQCSTSRQIAGLELRRGEVTPFNPHATLLSWMLVQALQDNLTACVVGWPDLDYIAATQARKHTDQLLVIEQSDPDAAARSAQGVDVVIFRSSQSLAPAALRRFQAKIRATEAVMLLVTECSYSLFPQYKAYTREFLGRRHIEGIKVGVEYYPRPHDRRMREILIGIDPRPQLSVVSG